jgi:hypothetical protein
MGIVDRFSAKVEAATARAPLKISRAGLYRRRAKSAPPPIEKNKHPAPPKVVHYRQAAAVF